MTATTVSVRSYVHAVTHVTNNIIKSLKDIILQSGLDPGKISSQWVALELGIRTWIQSEHLQVITLEVFNPATNAPMGFWDIGVSYDYNGGEGEFWTDTDAIRYAIKKAGVLPSNANYDILVTTAPNRPPVSGWTTTTARSRAGFVEQRIGTTVEASGLSGNVSYFRKV